MILNSSGEKLESMDHFSWRRGVVVLILLLIGLSLRLLVLYTVEVIPATERELLYTTLAKGWTEKFAWVLDGKPTSVVMPLYPTLLGIFHLLSPESWKPVLLLQALAGVMAAWFAFRIAWHVTRSTLLSWLVFLGSLFFPPLFFYGLNLDPGPLASFCFVAALYCLTRCYTQSPLLFLYVCAAVFFVIGFYLSPRFIVFIPFLVFMSALRSYSPSIGLAGVLIICLTCLIALMPWMIRNFILLGKFVPLTTGFVETMDSSLCHLSEVEQLPVTSSEALEVTRYEVLSQNVRDRISLLGLRDFYQIAKRSVLFWMTDYPGLFHRQKEHFPPGPQASLVFRACLYFCTSLFFVLYVLGFLYALTKLRAWVVWMAVWLGTLEAALMNRPSSDHLFYWSLASILSFWVLSGLWRFMTTSGKPKLENNNPETPNNSEVYQVPQGTLPPITGLISNDRDPTTRNSDQSNEKIYF